MLLFPKKRLNFVLCLSRQKGNIGRLTGHSWMKWPCSNKKWIFVTHINTDHLIWVKDLHLIIIIIMVIMINLITVLYIQMIG